MDDTLLGHAARLFEVWRYSPSVYSSDRTELVLAFKIARLLHLPGSKVLKALRGVPGPTEEMVRRVELFVESDPTLVYVQDGDRRRIALVD